MMRCEKGWLAVVTLVLALVTLTGSAYTDQFSQAAQAQSAGFDALAHDLFDGALQPDSSLSGQPR